jgi:methenyltetrahydromethanopterin cyclohydrolase
LAAKWKPPFAEKISVNNLAFRIVKDMIERCGELNIEVNELKNGTTIVDCGINAVGGFEAGILATKVACGGLLEACITETSYGGLTLPTLFMRTDNPALSIAVCQSNWFGLFPSLFAMKKTEYSALSLGPAKALAQEPKEVFDKVDYKDKSDVGVLVLQADNFPDEKVSEYIASKCKISPENLYLVMAPTASVAGSVQVSAHVLEDSLWRLTDYLDYEYSKVKYITGSSPISPVYPEIWRRPGITPDDMIRNAGRIHFYVYSSEGDDLQKIADEMIIEKTQAFGKPFFEILNSGIFSKGLDKKTLGREGWTYVIAEAMVTDLRTGKVFKAGKIHADLIRKFMGI